MLKTNLKYKSIYKWVYFYNKSQFQISITNNSFHRAYYYKYRDHLYEPRAIEHVATSKIFESCLLGYKY